ncbi:Aminotransferase, class IV, partial [mine drainage metagenome]
TGDGHVAEASSSNLFLVMDGTVVTPQASDDVLVGITRDCVLQLVRQQGWPLEVRRVDRSELLSANEAFLSGTGVQLAPIIEVDGRTIGNGEIGPMTEQLQRSYLQVVRGEVEEMAAWRTPVPAAVSGNAAGRN